MTPTERGVARAALAGAAVLFCAGPARAHTNAQLGDFYQGLLQPVFHLEFLLAAVAIALWSTQQEGRARFATCAAFATAVLIGSAASLLGVRSEASLWGPRLCMLVAGPLVAARVRLPLTACATLAFVAGLAQGHAATAAELSQVVRPLPWTFGLGAGAALLGVYANGAADRFRAFWLEVGVRVAGSWIAAIGLMLGATALRGR